MLFRFKSILPMDKCFWHLSIDIILYQRVFIFILDLYTHISYIYISYKFLWKDPVALMFRTFLHAIAYLYSLRRFLYFTWRVCAWGFTFLLNGFLKGLRLQIYWMCLFVFGTCFSCRPVILTTFFSGFICRCGGMFCSIHRYSDKHVCAFDYKVHTQNPDP